jgi:PPK2 family polyphosphate:nucleotide phosphotransferase
MASDRERWLIPPKSRVHLAKIDPRSTDGVPGDKIVTKATQPVLATRLAELQERLYAESSRSLLLILQGMDTSGKGGTVKHCLRGINPAGVRVSAFKAPNEVELAHDFLWRVHVNVPRRGNIGVFDRSHYEDVMIVRVHGLVPEDVWRRRYDHIKAFEANLADAGTAIVKVFLHISRDEQVERLQARLDNKEKHWKFQVSDLEERERWDDYQEAFEDAIEATTADDAPWYVVPADRKWYRNWAVMRILIETLEAMDPQFPPSETDLSGITIPP